MGDRIEKATVSEDIIERICSGRARGVLIPSCVRPELRRVKRPPACAVDPPLRSSPGWLRTGGGTHHSRTPLHHTPHLPLVTPLAEPRTAAGPRGRRKVAVRAPPDRCPDLFHRRRVDRAGDADSTACGSQAVSATDWILWSHADPHGAAGAGSSFETRPE